MLHRRECYAVAGLLGLASCFVMPDTLGTACVQDLDCNSGQSCEQGICVEIGDSDAAASETGTGTGTDTGTDTSTEADTSTDMPEPLPDGSVRLVHAAPDVGPVDVYSSGSDQPLVEGLAYAEVSNWLDIDIGDYSFELRPAGADPLVAPLHVSDVVAVDEGDRISVVAAGLLDGGPEDLLRSLAIREDWGTDLADRARARIVHAGSDAPTLTIDGLEGPPFVLSRFADSPAAGVPLDLAGERVELFEGDTLLTAFTTPPLAEGEQVLLVATGLFGALAREDDGFSLIAVGEDGLLGRVLQDPQVFTLHGAYDAGNLENCTNDFEVAANFNFGEVQSAFLSPGDYDFEIFGYPSGCTGTPLNPGGNASGALEAGERYMLLLTGEQSPDEGEPALQVATFRDRFATDQVDATSIRFVHGASAEQIYVGNVTDGEIKAEDVYTNPIAWRSESEPSSLAQGMYLLGVADAINLPAPPLTPLVTFDFTSTAGPREWGIVAGDPSPGPGDKIIQLLLIDTATPGWDVEIININ